MRDILTVLAAFLPDYLLPIETDVRAPSLLSCIQTSFDSSLHSTCCIVLVDWRYCTVHVGCAILTIDTLALALIGAR
mgnify:FL=1